MTLYPTVPNPRHLDLQKSFLTFRIYWITRIIDSSEYTNRVHQVFLYHSNSLIYSSNLFETKYR